MKTTTMRIAAIATTTIVMLTGAFWAGSESSAEVEYKTKTVTKTVDNPVEHCLTGTLKNYGLAYDVIDECQNLTDAEKNEAIGIAEAFVDALFAETYEG